MKKKHIACPIDEKTHHLLVMYCTVRKTTITKILTDTVEKKIRGGFFDELKERIICFLKNKQYISWLKIKKS